MSGKSRLRGAIAVVILVAVILAAAWILLHATGESSDEGREVARTGAIEPEATIPPAPPREKTDFGPPSALDPSAPAEAPKADGVGTASSAPFDGPTLRVLLPDGIEPAPGAAVEFVDLEPIERDEVFEAKGHKEAIFEKYGVPLTTDAEGRVRLPRFGRNAWIQARLGELYGRTDQGRSVRDEIRLTLREESTLTIRTVDGSGLPYPGVPVAVFRTVSGIDTSEVYPCWTGVTEGATASCVVPHFGWLLENEATEGGLLGRRLVVSPDLLTLEPAQVPIDPLRPPEAAVLETPPFGGLIVRVLGVDGEPLRQSVLVDVIVADWESPWAFDSRRQRNERTESGVARIECVETGRSFKIRATTAGLEPIETESPGPRLPGEEVEVELRFEREIPKRVATMTLLFPDGRAAADRDVAVQFPDGDPMVDRRPLRPTHRTDESGRVRVDLGRPWRIGDRPARVVRFLFPFEDEARKSQPEWVGETRLPPDLLPGEIDGGEVRLAPVPLLAAGRVVDPSNRPIPGARVTVSAPGTMKTSEAVAGEDGTFAVWGFIADAEIRIRAWKREFLQFPSTTLPTGTRDCVLVLRRATRIRGLVVSRAGVDVRWLRGALEASDGEHDVHIDDSGSFVCTAEPGSAELRFFLRGGDTPVHVVPGIALEEGETRDLGTIVIEAPLEVGEITVSGADGRAIRAARIYLATAASPEIAWLAGTDRFGHARFAVQALPANLVVGACGHRLRAFTFVGGAADVLLQPGIPVTLRVQGETVAAAWPTMGHNLEMVRSETGWRLAPLDEVMLRGYEPGDDGTVRYLLPRAGEYTVEWHVSRKGRFLKEGKPEFFIEETVRGPETITVLDTDAEQIFEFEIDPEVLAAARARLEQVPEDRE